MWKIGRQPPGPRGPGPLFFVRPVLSVLLLALFLTFLPGLVWTRLARGATDSGPLAGSTSIAARPASPPRVLLVISGSRLAPPNVLFDEVFREVIAKPPAVPVECWTEFLDEERFPEQAIERTGAYVRGKYREDRLDVVVAVGAPAFDLCLRERRGLFAGVPLVFAELGGDSLPRSAETGVTGVRSHFDGEATLRLALRLHPRTQQVYILAGPESGDSTGSRASWPGAGIFPVPVRFLGPRPLPDLEQSLSALPEHSLVLDLSGLSDHPDAAAPGGSARQALSEASTAPIYGPADPLVGNGLVGAVTTPLDESARAVGAMVREVIAQRGTGALPGIRNLAVAPILDWRQLQRWHVRKSLLPPGSLVRFEPRSFWRQHLVLVLTLSGLFLVQSGLILALVLQSVRRKRAELEARRRREELAHTTRVATMGELTASLAHEINQPLAAILSNAQAGLRLLASGEDHLEEIREILADIAADDQRAGEVIRRMRALLRRGEYNPVALDLNDLIDEVVGLVRGEMILHNVSLVLEPAPRLRPVLGDRVQLQQVLLNLMMNAMDAMREVPDANRRMVVRTAVSGASAVEVAVEDNGVGIPDGKLGEIFEPFVTTKAHGIGLGLAICRSIMQAHGGRIGARPHEGRGATFWFTLPAIDERKL